MFNSKSGPEITLGSHVEAQWTNGRYYGATVQQYQDGQYLVVWDDGSKPLWVSPDQVRAVGKQSGPSPVAVGTRVRALWADGKPYAATVTEFDGQQYRVTWHDGSPPSWVFPMNLQPDAGAQGGGIAVGSSVMAQWTNGSYYRASVREFNGSQYLVVWDDGSPPLWVNPNQVRLA